jgi:hypothetical protein
MVGWEQTGAAIGTGIQHSLDGDEMSAPISSTSPAATPTLVATDKPTHPTSAVPAPPMHAADQTSDLRDAPRCMERINKTPPKTTFSKDDVAELLQRCLQPGFVSPRITAKPAPLTRLRGPSRKGRLLPNGTVARRRQRLYATHIRATRSVVRIQSVLAHGL